MATDRSAPALPKVGEKPILFSAPMVRAILDGRKTQTRRVVKPQPEWGHRAGVVEPCWNWKQFGFVESNSGHSVCMLPSCPFGAPGAPGDRLWVRETFSAWSGGMTDCGEEWDCIEGSLREYEPRRGIHGTPVVEYRADRDETNADLRWRPSIHMPRWASRITLVVKAVRVERLQAISEDDAVAEGARNRFGGLNAYQQERAGWSLCDPHPVDVDAEHGWQHCLGTARFAFANLWNEINVARAPWDSNPWVWVVEFERVTPTSTVESPTERVR